MTDGEMAQIAHEGQSIEVSDSENDNSSSSPDENNDTEDTHSPDGDENNQDDADDKKPFNEHPRWKEREDSWTSKFNDQERRHQDDLKALREEFGTARKENAEQTKIPSWFGGSQEQWDAYKADRDSEIKAAEERAFERINSAKTAEDKAVAEATAFMKSELSSIQSDKTLNPDGVKIDPNKLLKIVMDDNLIDGEGRWNYRAGFKIYKATVKPKVNTTVERKVLAGATTSESKPESKPQKYKTSADFKKNKPW